MQQILSVNVEEKKKREGRQGLRKWEGGGIEKNEEGGWEETRKEKDLAG